MFTRILVPTDFSASSDAALAHARRLADSTGASLHVLHVVDDLSMRTALADPRHYEAAALWQLQEQLPDGDAGAILVVEHSEAPADEITRYARTHNIDLIVMGTHGRRRRRRMPHLLLGSVAEQVVRTAPCPVLTMREGAGVPELNGLRILVATDFSAPSDAALGYARRLAAKVRGTIRLLHVVEQPASARSVDSELSIPEPSREEQAATPRVHLSHRMLVDSRSRVKIDSDVIFGPTGVMITAYAADNGFDLIVMGTRGRGGLAHLLMGSVAASVIRTAPCPVLTVKSGEVGRVRTADARGAVSAAV